MDMNRKEEADWRDSNRVEVDWAGGRIVVGRETVGKHVGQWVLPNGLHYGDDSVANLNPKAVPASTPRPHRPTGQGEAMTTTDPFTDAAEVASWEDDRHPDDTGAWSRMKFMRGARWARTHLAALTEPPKRPEGAEGWEDWLIEAMPHETMPDEDIALLADRIAQRLNEERS